MIPPAFEYYAPTSLQDALRLLRDPRAEKRAVRAFENLVEAVRRPQ